MSPRRPDLRINNKVLDTSLVACSHKYPHIKSQWEFWQKKDITYSCFVLNLFVIMRMLVFIQNVFTIKCCVVADVFVVSQMSSSAKKWTSQAGGNPMVRPIASKDIWNSQLRQIRWWKYFRWGPPYIWWLPVPEWFEGGALVVGECDQLDVEQPLVRPADPAGHLRGRRPQRSWPGARWRWVHSQQASWRGQPFSNHGRNAH